jgi:hypothetical protein
VAQGKQTEERQNTKTGLKCFEPIQRIMSDTPRADAMLEIEPKPPQSAVEKRCREKYATTVDS